MFRRHEATGGTCQEDEGNKIGGTHYLRQNGCFGGGGNYLVLEEDISLEPCQILRFLGYPGIRGLAGYHQHFNVDIKPIRYDLIMKNFA